MNYIEKLMANINLVVCFQIANLPNSILRQIFWLYSISEWIPLLSLALLKPWEQSLDFACNYQGTKLKTAWLISYCPTWYFCRCY